MERIKVEAIIRESGYTDFKWISGADIEVSFWTRFKCIYGCDSYGQRGTCPPNVPSIEECRKFFNEYENIAVIHLEKKLDTPEDRKKWSRKTNLNLLKVEKAIFLSGYHKTFLLFMDECRICEKCPGNKTDCIHPQQARPTPEGFGMDVFATVRKLGFPIEVLSDYSQTMNRYAFLLIE
jgi:predicted metal-binding protein